MTCAGAQALSDWEEIKQQKFTSGCIARHLKTSGLEQRAKYTKCGIFVCLFPAALLLRCSTFTMIYVLTSFFFFFLSHLEVEWFFFGHIRSSTAGEKNYVRILPIFTRPLPCLLFTLANNDDETCQWHRVSENRCKLGDNAKRKSSTEDLYAMQIAGCCENTPKIMRQDHHHYPSNAKKK